MKTIEIRKWATSLRGLIYIHASSKPDPRPEGWALMTDELRPLAEQGGGIIGQAELTHCVMYRTAEAFAAEAAQHHNAPSWFEPPIMYGFRFRQPALVPFHACRGQVKFFRVQLPEIA